MEPVLQVALDFMHKNRALEIAAEAVKGGADWIEAGTPLIKSEGSDVIRELKKAFPGHTIIADMKTMDVGAAEVEIASKAGADIISILGLADDSTIEEAVTSAMQYGSKIMIDLIGVADRVKRSKTAETLGVSYICLHIGIDQQMKGESSPIDILKQIVSEVSIPVAVAGGITQDTAPALLDAGASIIIAGGSIIKAKDVCSATEDMKTAMATRKSVASNVAKKYGSDELYDAFALASTANISDAMHRTGVLSGIVPRNKPGIKMIGRALTVQTVNGDWAKPVEAIDQGREGDVLVIDVGGGDTAVFGALAAWSCISKGIRGVVIDGAIRDMDEIYEMGFPAFSRYSVPNASEPKGFGGIGHNIICGGLTIKPGDWIIGDDCGVVVVPQEKATEIANRSVDVAERENRIREEIKKGSTLSKVLELEKWEQVH